ncbi:MAG: HD domain-containing protein [Gemmatimonadaceae bacterium]|nr:HD domain-containing protein [Gemmatimonadaceae bacterium]
MRAHHATVLRPQPEAPPASLSSLLGALSHALDLTEGAPFGHSLRSAAIALRLGEDIGLSDAERTALYFAVLLKDAGCSSNAAKVSVLFGSDDRIVKPRLKVVDARRRGVLAWHTFAVSSMGQGLAMRVRTLLGIAKGGAVTRELIQIRCERGAAIAERLGFPRATSHAIRALDEHWDGQGHPSGLRGSAIPLESRIANLAQTLDVFLVQHGPAAALAVARQRRSTWFDPALVDRVIAWRRDAAWWRALRHDAPDVVLARFVPAAAHRAVSAAALDEIAEAFADIVDAKSPYTYRHSRGVSDWADRIAARFTDDPLARGRLRRAALLHDIGKLGVSNRILDKPGPLEPAERAAVERHPAFTFEILSRVGAFADIAEMAALHHEKLDGSGYPWRRTGESLDRWARILAVADIFEALTADRPYRAAIGPAEVLRRLERDRGTQLDGEVLDALADAVATGGTPMPRAA